MLTMFSRKGQLGRTAHSYFTIVWGRRNPFWMRVIPRVTLILRNFNLNYCLNDTWNSLTFNTTSTTKKNCLSLPQSWKSLLPRLYPLLWSLLATKYKKLGFILYAVAAYPSSASSARSITFQNLFQNSIESLLPCPVFHQ